MMLILYLLSAYAVISIGYSLYKRFLHRDIKNQYVLVNIESDGDGAEGVIRCLMRENPDSEIVVVNNSDEQEITEIIEKLCHDYPRVHMPGELDFFK